MTNAEARVLGALAVLPLKLRKLIFNLILGATLTLHRHETPEKCTTTTYGANETALFHLNSIIRHEALTTLYEHASQKEFIVADPEVLAEWSIASASSSKSKDDGRGRAAALLPLAWPPPSSSLPLSPTGNTTAIGSLRIALGGPIRNSRNSVYYDPSRPEEPKPTAGQIVTSAALEEHFVSWRHAILKISLQMRRIVLDVSPLVGDKKTTEAWGHEVTEKVTAMVKLLQLSLHMRKARDRQSGVLTLSVDGLGPGRGSGLATLFRDIQHAKARKLLVRLHAVEEPERAEQRARREARTIFVDGQWCQMASSVMGDEEGFFHVDID